MNLSPTKSLSKGLMILACCTGFSVFAATPSEFRVSPNIRGPIDSVELYYIPTSVNAFVAITPEELQKGQAYKIIIGHSYANYWIGKFAEITSVAKVHISTEPPDCRWGMIVKNRKGIILYSIFLDKNGKVGNCGQVNFTCDDSIISDWFNKITMGIDL